MFLLYLDESGDPDAWDHHNFVLGGVAVHEGQVYNLGQQLDAIQSKYFPNIRIPLAFHAAEIRAGKGHPFGELSQYDRDHLLQDVYDCIAAAEFPRLIAFATAMHISWVESPTQALHDAFQDILNRFNLFLIRLYKADRPNKGLLLMDQSREKRYRQLFSDFKRQGTQFQAYLGNIVDIPYFAGRHDTRMMQLADFCAFAVFRYYERHDDLYLRKILPRFDRRGPEEPPDGLKHLTRESCSCVACKWR